LTLSDYFDFIEAQRKLLQLGELEEHHIKSQKNYPELAESRENIITLSVENHDYATLLQCEEENFPLLCPWQANRLRASLPGLSERIDYWLSRRGKLSASYTSVEDRARGGRTSVENYRKRGELRQRMSDMARCRGEYPPAAWYWRVNPETGETESKLWEVPEEDGWKRGRPPGISKGTKKAPRKRVRCTITGHLGTPHSLARWQKNRGIDPSNREFVD